MKKIAIFAAIMVKSRILQILVLIIMPCMSMASNSSDTIKTWFDTWRENRKVYNAYRDSIFAPVERDAWVNLCIRRADAYRNMYRENKKMIDEMKAHFNRPDVPKADYDSLFSMCMNNGKGVDIFMAEDIMNILVAYYEKNHKTEYGLYNYLVCLYCLGSFEYSCNDHNSRYTPIYPTLCQSHLLLFYDICKFLNRNLHSLFHKLWPVITVQSQHIMPRILLRQFKRFIYTISIKIGNIHTAIISIIPTTCAHQPFAVATDSVHVSLQ